MTDTNKLCAHIRARGLKKSYIAKVLGISRAALSMKLGNRSEFKASEIDTLCELLNINDGAELKAVFFARRVD